MNSICLFASYYHGNKVPEYIKVFLAELASKFTRTILLCLKEPDTESAFFLRENNVEWLLVTDGGYDFGKWSQALTKIDVGPYDTLGLINDSCVLFKPLNEFWSWLKKEKAEVTGMTRSEFRGSHIQSYFLILRGRAVQLALKHFAETPVSDRYDDVITNYELAMNARFIREGLSLASFVDNGGYKGEFSPYYKCVDYHIRQGMPLIKKRILMADYRKAELFTLARMNFRISPKHYSTLIKVNALNLIFDPDKLVEENKMGFFQRLRYELTRMAINIGRPIKRLAFFSK